MTKNWRWFISKTLRDAVELHKQVIKLLAAQSDLIKPSRVDELRNALDALQAKLTGPVDKEAILDEIDAMMIVADRVLFPYPDPKARDWVEMFLVVAVLVLAFRTFFFQPFKIPTGSMQPTLYGITIENLMDFQGNGKVEQGMLTATNKPATFQLQHIGRTVTFANGEQATITQFKDSQHVKLSSSSAIDEQDFTVSFKLPGVGGKATDKLRGYSYASMQAEGNWQLIEIKSPKSTFPLISKQILVFKDLDTGKTFEKSEWFPPLDSHQSPVLKQSNSRDPSSVDYGQPLVWDEFSKGQYIFKMRVKTGDHLFVNRITYNFRRPRRGDICVFTTKGVVSPELFYIKRLVALGGESISIGRDRHIRIDGRRVDANDPGFEFLYDFSIEHRIINGSLVSTPVHTAVDSVYSGHVNNSHKSAQWKDLARNFNNAETTLKMKPSHYLMFGDNTTNSSDSRTWGQLPMRNVIGKSSFVYWPPLSPRFGWSHR